MLLNWQDFIQRATKAIGAFMGANPKIMEGMKNFEEACSSQNALDEKTRALIAVGVACTTRCDACIAMHSKAAAEVGATRAEILETLSVSVGISAGSAVVYSSRAMQAFDSFNQES